MIGAELAVAALLAAGGLGEPSSCSASAFTVWEWDAVPGARAYRLYWRDSEASAWSDCDSVEVLEPWSADPSPTPEPERLLYYQAQALAPEGELDGAPPGPVVLACAEPGP